MKSNNSANWPDKMETQTVPDIKIGEEPQKDTAYEPLYRVIIHNDDVTPMDFVVHVLNSIFMLLAADAVRVMFSAHYRGETMVQILPKSEAEKRINKVHFAAGLEGFPLHFSMEPE
jgi:ATP-dependent Clp protease adaptor protein ClpS